MSVLELLRGRMAARKTTADETLAAAAKRLAAGESIDHGAVETALVETRQTVDEFETMVATANRRRELRAALDKGPAANTKLEKLQTTAAHERAQFEKIQTAWFERAAELDGQIRAAETIVGRARDAREELVKPASVPEPVRTRLVEAHAALEEAHTKRSALEHEVKEVRDRLKQRNEFADHYRELNTAGLHGTAEDYETLAKRCERRLAELQPELDEALAAVADAEKELAAAESVAVKA
jgi:uncharacterized protein (DUF1778 family)